MLIVTELDKQQDTLMERWVETSNRKVIAALETESQHRSDFRSFCGSSCQTRGISTTKGLWR
ncbi:hypothetical protein D1820_16490 [Phaeobacter sp. LSS9]|nr:hypothetical protein D1820_16490 [Phaeobacter sp. LSS9]